MLFFRPDDRMPKRMMSKTRKHSMFLKKPSTNQAQNPESRLGYFLQCSRMKDSDFTIIVKVLNVFVHCTTLGTLSPLIALCEFSTL